MPDDVYLMVAVTVAAVFVTVVWATAPGRRRRRQWWQRPPA